MQNFLTDSHPEIGCLQISTNQHNSIDMGFVDQALCEFGAWDKDDNVKAVLITGSGRSFCTGANLQELANYNESQCIDFFHKYDKLLATIHNFWKPVVSIINGHALGGGLSIAQASVYSMSVNNDKAKIGFPELRLGLSLTPIMIEIMRTKSRMNMHRVLIGAILNPHEAQKDGFIDEVFPEDCSSRLSELIQVLTAIPRNAFGFYQTAVKRNLPTISDYDAAAFYKRIYQEIQEYINTEHD